MSAVRATLNTALWPKLRKERLVVVLRAADSYLARMASYFSASYCSLLKYWEGKTTPSEYTDLREVCKLEVYSGHINFTVVDNILVDILRLLWITGESSGYTECTTDYW